MIVTKVLVLWLILAGSNERVEYKFTTTEDVITTEDCSSLGDILLEQGYRGRKVLAYVCGLPEDRDLIVPQLERWYPIR